MNVNEMGQGVWSLATDASVWDQLKTTTGEVFAGDAYVIGEVIGSVVIPGAGAIKFSKPTGLLKKLSGEPDFGKPIKYTDPKKATSALDGLKKPESSDVPSRNPNAGKPEVANPFDPNRKGALLPDVRYRASAPGTSHKYMYETNADGLIDRVSVEKLNYKPDRDRLRNARETPGKLPGDEAGHLIADMFDGSPALDNLISQAKALNRGAGSKWARMERDWSDALTGKPPPPRSVTDIEIKVLYDDSMRPTGF